MRKAIKQHEERNVKGRPAEKEPSDPIPSYLLDRANPTTAKALSSQIKNKRAEKAARFSVPIPKVRGISEEEMFKVYVILCLGWQRHAGEAFTDKSGTSVSRRARRHTRRVRLHLGDALEGVRCCFEDLANFRFNRLEAHRYKGPVNQYTPDSNYVANLDSSRRLLVPISPDGQSNTNVSPPSSLYVFLQQMWPFFRAN